MRIRRPHLHRGTAAAAVQKLAEGGTPDAIPCTYQVRSADLLSMYPGLELPTAAGADLTETNTCPAEEQECPSSVPVGESWHVAA